MVASRLYLKPGYAAAFVAFLALCLGLCGFGGSAAAAEPVLEVQQVVIDGARHVHPDRVRFILSVRAGKTYTESQLGTAVADDVRAIEKMGPFTNTRSELQFGDDPKSVTVLYHFTELPYVTAVRYEGLSYFEREKVAKLVQVKPGSYLNDLLLDNDRSTIQRTFQNDGDRYCRVETSVEKDPQGNATVVFTCHLGLDIKVDQVFYVGLPDAARPLAIDRKLQMKKGEAYLPELLPIDQGAVVRALQYLGYLDARLVSTRVEIYDYIRPVEDRHRHGPDIAPDAFYNDRVTITYEIEPGIRYKLGKVSFVGNTVATQEQLRKAFALPEGSWFLHEAIYGEEREDGDLGSIEHARRLISNQGYARCYMRDVRALDVQHHIVDLTLQVDEGAKYHIGRVDIRGNETSRDPVVRRAMFLNTGDLWNDDLKDESRDQIRRAGVFSNDPPRPVAIEPQFPEDRPDQADLEVDVAEKNTGSVSVQIGYSTATKVFGALGYTESNFDLRGLFLSGFQHYRGAGQILSLNASWSRPQKTVSLSLTNPHLLDGPYSLSGEIERSQSTLNEWAEVRIASSVTVGRNFLRNHLHLDLTYGYTDLAITDVQSDAPPDAVGGHYYLNSLGLSQTYDHLLPDRANPTSGYQVSASEGLYGYLLKSSANISEYSLKGDEFIPLRTAEDGGVTYFHATARYRQEDPIGDTAEVPFYQRYFDGGAAPHHRGFEQNYLSPHAYNAYGELTRTGGTRNALGTFEISVPVQGTAEGVRGVLFTDIGNVWAQNDQIRYQDLRTAIGFGVRFPPQIPIALDFAYLLDRRSGESATQVQFGLGTYRF